MADLNVPDFFGKVLILEYGSSSQGVAYVEDPHFEEQAGRLFVIGTSPIGVSPGFDGTPVAVAWDTVTAYHVFDSAADVREAVEKWYPKKSSWFGAS